MATAYPAHLEADVMLRDGSTVRVRPVRPEDAEGIQALFEGLSEEARIFRFFTGAIAPNKAEALARDIDYVDRFALIATRGAEGRILAHGMYARTAPDRAEVAFAVADELQGQGLGTILLAHLAEAARGVGVETLEAEVMPHNHRMIEVFRESGFPVELSSEPGSIHIELPTEFSDDARARFQQREAIAAAAAARHFLAPESIAVIGASRHRGTVGGEIIHNVAASGFPGPIYPVNPKAREVEGLRAYPRVGDVPGPVELAVIAVPGPRVLDVARECAAHDVRGIIVISAGFGETGEEGRERQRELLEVCRASGMRMIGPNCLGVMSLTSEAPFNATFAPRVPPAGNVAFASQSGAMGLALIEFAAERGLGISAFASLGNRADITANDLLEYWHEDERTDVALLYIESFSNPRRFARVARRVGRRKPIVAVKSGRSRAGARATSSHTGAMLAASDVTVDALFRQAGVIRTDTLAELLDVAALLANQPLPEGNRVGILTNAGGPAIMCADACEAAGLSVPPLDEQTANRLRELLPAEASVANPVDMIATATADQYREAIRIMAASEGIDALIVIFVRPLLTRSEDVAASVREAAAELPREIPLQAVFMSPEDHASGEATEGIPTYAFPESAAVALARVHEHVRWRARPVEPPVRFADARTEEAAATLAQALEEGREWLGFDRLEALLSAHGLPLARSRLVLDADAAVEAARELGTAVALKAEGPGIVHKTDLGALELDLRDPDDVRAAAARIEASLERAGLHAERFLVQEMIPAGVELLVGVVLDETFGPVVACGTGGTEAELRSDVAVRLTPLTRYDAREMLRSLQMYPLLTGYRGAPPADVGAVEELLLRTSAMVEAHAEIAELDLNPVIAGPHGAVIADARVRVEPAGPSRPWPRTGAGSG
ncbi:MAG TPA: GNAT family N-acetyltransferase [Solirubrobacterales bacterium]